MNLTHSSNSYVPFFSYRFLHLFWILWLENKECRVSVYLIVEFHISPSVQTGFKTLSITYINEMPGLTINWRIGYSGAYCSFWQNDECLDNISNLIKEYVLLISLTVSPLLGILQPFFRRRVFLYYSKLFILLCIYVPSGSALRRRILTANAGVEPFASRFRICGG